MIIGDKATRNKAIPFEALPFDEYDLNYLSGILGSVAQMVPIRFTRPHAGQIVELYLTLQLHAASAAGFTVRLMIGRFSNDNLDAVSFYSEAEIAREHRRITGKDTGYTVAANGTLFIDDLSLLPALPQRDDADFNDDGFVLVLVFDSTPIITSGWSLDALRITGTAQMGLL